VPREPLVVHPHVRERVARPRRQLRGEVAAQPRGDRRLRQRRERVGMRKRVDQQRDLRLERNAVERQHLLFQRFQRRDAHAPGARRGEHVLVEAAQVPLRRNPRDPQQRRPWLHPLDRGFGDPLCEQRAQHLRIHGIADELGEASSVGHRDPRRWSH
jgi:hypothetical protein